MRWLLLLALVPACATVKPYERSLLQSRVMQVSLDPLEAAADAHVLGTREVMIGGAAAGASSCGCN